MAEDVILAIPNETDPFMVEANASEGAVGAVLSQKQNGKWCPVAFMSKSLSATECNYEIYDKELLAIMLALDEWRHYLMGAAVDVEIWTDHQNLQYFRKASEAEPTTSALGDRASGVSLRPPPQARRSQQEG